jgi:tight adherence protein C
VTGIALGATIAWMVVIVAAIGPLVRPNRGSVRAQALVGVEEAPSESKNAAGFGSRRTEFPDAFSIIGRRLRRGLEVVVQWVIVQLRLSPQSSLLARRISIEDRTLGILVVLAGVAVLIDPFVGCLVLAFGIAISAIHPRLAAARRQRSAHAASEAALPHLIDIVRACMASGILPRHVLVALHRNVSIDSLAFFQADLAELASTSESGTPFVEALERLKAAGPNVVAFVAALAAGERYGIALGPTLDALAVDARSTNRRRLEARARRLPIALLFPLVVCILPAFALLTVVPLLLSGLTSLKW